MKRLAAILALVTMTFICWGSYAPLLHEGQDAMNHSRWRPFICVGVAYFFVAVCGPLIVGRFAKDAGKWTVSGIFWSLLAGAVGAFGALGVLLAFSVGGSPLFVMPIVFGFAPIINTLVTFTMRTGQPASQAGVVFLTGILLVALGAAGVLRFKPSSADQLEREAPRAIEPGDEEKHDVPTERLDVEDSTIAPHLSPSRIDSDESEPASNKPDIDSSEAVPDAQPESAPSDGSSASILPPEPWRFVSQSSDPIRTTSSWLTLLYVGMTALCWGAYGSLLHIGQSAMLGSRFRPFICVGISYFVVAIVFPVILLTRTAEPLSFPLVGSLWSLAAGVMGALGALGIIMAFNLGGRPVMVMPLVFGGAPIMNTLVSIIQLNLRGTPVAALNRWFIASLLLVIAGAALVLVFAPKAYHTKPHDGSIES